MENKIYVSGHKNPDTDSVTSAIALSYLKNQLGMDTIPVVLGSTNNETKYVLDYFKVPEPSYLNDVKLQIKDVDYDKENYIYANVAIIDAYHTMVEKKISNLPVVDENHKLLGLVSMKDIARELIMGDNTDLKTPYDKLLEVLKATEVLRFDEKICGKLIIAAWKNTTFLEKITIEPDTILIMGDRPEILDYAIEGKAKMIILTGDAPISDEVLKRAKENKVNIIRTEYQTIKVSQMITLCNEVETIYLRENVVSVSENETVSQFMITANNNKYSNYPVIDKEKVCLGMIKVSDTVKKHPKKVILVDHSETKQSIDGLDEAEILEIVDHHNIGSIGTSNPIYFRNMPVGCTNTVLYSLYKENHVEIPKEIAGLMLSGLISDTLLLTSPTTTDADRAIIDELASIAGVDYQKYGMDMLKAGTSIVGKTKEEIVTGDFKTYPVGNQTIAVSQTFTFDINEYKKEESAYIEAVNKQAETNNYMVFAFFVTDVLDNSSYAYFNDKALSYLDNAFNNEKASQGMYLPGVVSRKKQIIPVIMEALK